MKKHFAKLFSLLLSITIIFTVIVYAGAESGTSQNETQSITMTEYDPETGNEIEKVYVIDSSIMNAMSLISVVPTKPLLNEPTAQLLSTNSSFSATSITEVSDTTVMPYSPIGFFKITGIAGVIKGYGTAFMVSKNVALTCAHNLYDKENNRWNSGGHFYPGKHGFGVMNDPFGATYAKKWAVCTQYIENTDRRLDPLYDWGAIVLDEPIGNECGYLPFSVIEFDDLINSSVLTSGYPQESVGFPINYNQYKTTGTVNMVMDDFFSTTLTFEGGQSGSPVLYNGTVCGIVSCVDFVTKISDTAYQYLTQYILDNA